MATKKRGPSNQGNGQSYEPSCKAPSSRQAMMRGQSLGICLTLQAGEVLFFGLVAGRLHSQSDSSIISSLSVASPAARTMSQKVWLLLFSLRSDLVNRCSTFNRYPSFFLQNFHSLPYSVEGGHMQRVCRDHLLVGVPAK